MQEETNSQDSGSHQKDCPNLAEPQPAKCTQPHWFVFYFKFMTNLGCTLIFLAVVLHFSSTFTLRSQRWLFSHLISFNTSPTPPFHSDNFDSFSFKKKLNQLERNSMDFYHNIYLPTNICTHIVWFSTCEHTLHVPV